MRVRRYEKSTLTVASTYGFRRSQVLIMNGELVLVHRILSNTMLELRPYRGWRRLRHWCLAQLRRPWRAAKDRVLGWFERDDEEW